MELQPIQAGAISSQFGGQDVNKQQFLDLLVTQLRNQDPLSPMENEAFLSQLATFSQLEETQSTNSLLTDLIHVNQADLALGGLAQGASLVGKVVEYINPQTGAQVRGTVYSVFFDPSGVLVEVDGNIVPAGSIVTISTEPPSTGSSTDPNAGNGNGNGTGSNGSGSTSPTGGTPSPILAPSSETDPNGE